MFVASWSACLAFSLRVVNACSSCSMTCLEWKWQMQTKMVPSRTPVVHEILHDNPNEPFGLNGADEDDKKKTTIHHCLLYTSPSPRD